MKNILKFSAVAIMAFLLSGLTGCTHEGLETDQFSGFSLAAVAPNPVMRGGVLRIVGSNLENVAEVRFAGDVVVTDIEVVASGARSEIRVTVPLEGPQVGKVTIVDKNGNTRSTRADLTFTEPIVIDSFSPATVLSGDEVTVKGEYLNTVKEVILADGNYITEFVSQDRHELKFIVPSQAITGFIILGDVNELEDENTIPNQVYSATELVVAKPAVTVAAKAVYKSGDVITVTGNHLDMVKSVEVPQAGEVEFTVSADGKTITFNLPPKAGDGNITLTTYAGDVFVAGEIESLNVTDLTVTSLATDGRFKAGSEVSISGSDLDLVTSVSFENAEASWYLNGNTISATVPDAAKDGPVTVSLESGKKAYSEDIEVVKPRILAWEKLETVVAGESILTIEDDDLDLVTAVQMGDKEHGFIDCEFTFETTVLGFVDLKVAIPEQAYTSAITVTSAAGYSDSTYPIEITYNMGVSIDFDQEAYGLGSNITISGKNLLQIDQMYIKGKRVVNYVKRADDAMAFGIPEGVGPGVYRLALTLMDGSEITWPVPFSITAPFTETFIWEGYEDMGSWSNQPYYGADGAFADAGLEIGDIVRIYYTPLANFWQFQIFGGHWEGMTFPELDGGNTVSVENTEADAKYFAFEVTADNYGILTGVGGWGGALLTQGEGVAITGVSFVHFGAADIENFIFEGYEDMNGWTNQPYYGAEDAFIQLGIAVGNHIRIYYTPLAESWQFQIFSGHWEGMTFPEAGGTNTVSNENTEAGAKYFEFEVTDANIGLLTSIQGWGGALLTQGENVAITGVSLVQAGAVAMETILWEGSEALAGWVNQPYLGGEGEWAELGLKVGDTVRVYFTATIEEWIFQIYGGHWEGLTFAEIGGNELSHENFDASAGYFEFTVTEDLFTAMTSVQGWGGAVVVQGDGVTITKIAIQ